MNTAVLVAAVQGWLLVFIPLGLLGLGLWALWRLIPKLRKSMGYRGFRPR